MLPSGLDLRHLLSRLQSLVVPLARRALGSEINVVRLLPVDDVTDDVMHHPASLSISLILTYSTDIPGLPRREKVSLLVHSGSQLKANHRHRVFSVRLDWVRAVALRARPGRRRYARRRGPRREPMGAARTAGRQLSLNAPRGSPHDQAGNRFFVALVRRASEHGGQLREWLNEADAAARYENAAVRLYEQARLPSQMGRASGPRTAGQCRSCWSTTPAPSICRSWRASWTAIRCWLRGWPGTGKSARSCCSASAPRPGSRRPAARWPPRGRPPPCGSPPRRSTSASPARPGRCGCRCSATRAPPGRRTRAGTAPQRRGRPARRVGRRGGVPMMPVLITCHRVFAAWRGHRCRAICRAACQPFLHRYALLVVPPQVRRANRQHRPSPDTGTTGMFPGLRTPPLPPGRLVRKAGASRRVRVAATGDGRASKPS